MDLGALARAHSAAAVASPPPLTSIAATDAFTAFLGTGDLPLGNSRLGSALWSWGRPSGRCAPSRPTAPGCAACRRKTASGRPFFLNRDPIEEAGGINLYGFCGNDSVNQIDVLGNSWLSSLWDHTIGWLGKKIAQDWDDGGRTIAEAVGVIVASYFIGVEASDLLFSTETATYAGEATAAEEAAGIGGTVTETTYSGALAGAVGSGTISATTAGTLAGIGAGAGAGFVAGGLGTALSGGSLGQVMTSALRGGISGAVMGGVDGYFGTATPWERIPATAIAGGVSAQLSDGNFRQGLEIGGIEGLAVYGWGLMRDFTDEVGENTAANDLAQNRYNYDETGELMTDGTILPQDAPSAFGATADEIAAPITDLLNAGGMNPQGVLNAHWYDTAPAWLGGGMDGPIAGFINAVSKVHDFWEGWDYNVSAGTWISRGAAFNGLYDIYGMVGMPVAGAYTAAALSPSTVYVAEQGH